jgi:hypothetical protein
LWEGMARRWARTPHRPFAAQPLLGAWAAEAAAEGDNGPTVKAYRAAFAAFDKVKPTTTLGLFLTLLHGDEGDDFADEHPAAVDAIIAQLQAANVPLRSLVKAKKGGAA